MPIPRDDVVITRFFSGYLALLLLYAGLGPTFTSSDFHFWYQSSRLTVGLEWGLIFLYFLLSGRLSPLVSLLTGRYRSTLTIAILWLMTVILSYLTSDFYAPGNSLATLRLAETITHLLFFLVLWDFFSNYRADFPLIFAAVATPGIIISLLLALGLALDLSPAGTWKLPLPHWEALHLNDNIRRLGYQLVISAAGLFYFFRSSGLRPLFLIFYALLVFFIFWLGGRASLLGLAGAIALFAYMNKDRRVTVAILLATVVALILFISADYLNLWGTGHGGSTLVERTFHSRDLDRMSSGRLELWSTVLKNWLDHPWLGGGPQSCFFLPNRGVMIIHPHNFLLQFLLEWGVVGTLLFLLLLYRALRNGWRHYRQNPRSCTEHVAAASLLLALTLIGFFGGSYFFVQTVIPLLLAYALWASSPPET